MPTCASKQDVLELTTLRYRIVANASSFHFEVHYGNVLTLFHDATMGGTYAHLI